MISNGDYRDESKYAHSSLAPLAGTLTRICTYSIPVKGQPKKKGSNNTGRPIKYRLGSTQSTVGMKPKRVCTFCGGHNKFLHSGGTCHAFNSCLLFKSWGFGLKSTDGDAGALSRVISSIGTVDDVHSLIDLRSIQTDVSGYMIVHDALPRDTSHLVVRSFSEIDIGIGIGNANITRCLLCSCLNGQGSILVQRIAHKITSYDNIFVPQSLVLASLRKLKFVFIQPVQGASLESLIETTGALKSGT